MNRKFLKGQEDDKINALLAGIGANLRKLLAAFWPALVEYVQIGLSWCRRMWMGYKEMRPQNNVAVA